MSWEVDGAVIGACVVLFAAGAAGHAWAASYAEIDITDTSPTEIDMYGDTLYVLDDTGVIYAHTGQDLATVRTLHANNTAPAGMLAYDTDTIYVPDRQGMVYAYGTDPHVVSIHPGNSDPVAITGYDTTVYVADDSGHLYAYTIQTDQRWVHDTIIALPIPGVWPSAMYVHDGIIHAAYVAFGTAHVYEYDKTWNMAFSLALENSQMDITSSDDSIYVLDGSVIYEYDTGGNPIIVYDITTPAANPMGISVFDGLFYILDHKYVHRSDTWDIVADVGDVHIPTGLFVYDDDIGTVYVADDMSDVIYVNDTHTAPLHPDNMHPVGVTAEDDTAYVADSNAMVYVYDIRSDGEWVYEYVIALDERNRSPVGVSIDGGILYVADDSAGMIYGYTGKLWSLLGMIPLYDDNLDPVGVASYGSRLYVMDGNGIVYSYVNTIDGWKWTHDISLHSEILYPADVSVSEGVMYVGDGATDMLYTYDKVWDSTYLSTGGIIGGITMYDDTLYAMATYSDRDPVIAAYERIGDIWHRYDDIKLHDGNDCPAGMGMQDHTLFVTDRDGGVYVYGDDKRQKIDLYFENSYPADVTIYDESMYVLDPIDDAVYVYDQFDETWFYSYHFSLDRYGANPSGIVIDKGKMYIVYQDDNIISVYQSLRGTSSDSVSLATSQPHLSAQ